MKLYGKRLFVWEPDASTAEQERKMIYKKEKMSQKILFEEVPEEYGVICGDEKEDCINYFGCFGGFSSSGN